MTRKIIKPPQTAETSPLLSVVEAAAYLNVSVRTLDVWRCEKRYSIPFIKVGSSVKYRRTDLENWLESRTRGGVLEGVAA